MRDAVDDDGRLEDAERGRDHFGLDLAEHRAAAREVRGAVGHRDAAELARDSAANPSCYVRRVASGEKYTWPTSGSRRAASVRARMRRRSSSIGTAER